MKFIIEQIKRGILFLVFIIATFCNATLTTAQNQDALQNVNAISSFNDSCMSEGLWTGAVVLAGTADTTFFRHAWGYTSTEKTIQIPEDAIFDLASITKPVATATAIAVCMDRGLIDVSAPFTQFLPGYQGKLQMPVSVLDLARHISGFDNSKSFMTGGPVIENVLHCNPVCQPKQQFEYACINYILLGMIVEKVSGKPFAEFCRENIFDPLSMIDTQWSPLQKSDRVVKSAFTPEQGVVSDNPARAAGRSVGNAGLFSTADDLAKFCRMMLANGKCGKNQVLSEEAIKALTVKADTCSPLAMGWFIDKSSNPPSLSGATLSHTGWTGNTIWIDPVQKCFVIVLTNRSGDHGRASRARAELAELVVKEWNNKTGVNRN